MIKNYFKIAFANLIKSRVYSLITSVRNKQMIKKEQVEMTKDWFDI